MYVVYNDSWKLIIGVPRVSCKTVDTWWNIGFLMKGKTRTHIGLEICSIEQTTIHGTCYTIRRCFYLGEILVYRVLSKLSITVEIAKNILLQITCLFLRKNRNNLSTMSTIRKIHWNNGVQSNGTINNVSDGKIIIVQSYTNTDAFNDGTLLHCWIGKLINDVQSSGNRERNLVNRKPSKKPISPENLKQLIRYRIILEYSKVYSKQVKL